MSKQQKESKSKLLSENTALVSINDISKSGGILSAEFHINKLKGKAPYIFKDGKYTPAKTGEIKNAEYLTPIQVEEMNNLLYAQKRISAEIERIKQCKNYKSDQEIEDSKLSGRAKNACYCLLKKNVNDKPMLSEVANVPLKLWVKARGMGAGTLKELKEYVVSKGFTLIEK